MKTPASFFKTFFLTELIAGLWVTIRQFFFRPNITPLFWYRPAVLPVRRHPSRDYGEKP